MSDRIAKQVITIGGIGTILIVLLVVLVLLGNVLPMFQPNVLEPITSFPVTESADDAPLACGVDEYSELLWTLHQDDSLTVHSIATGELVTRKRDPNSNGEASNWTVTSCTVADNDSSMLAGYSDGFVRPITLAISVEFVKASDVDSSILESLKSGVHLDQGTIYRSMPSGLVRKQNVNSIVFHPRIAFSDKPISSTDWKTPQAASSFDETQSWCWSASDGKKIGLGTVENRVNSFNGEVTQEVKTWSGDHGGKPDTSILTVMIGPRSDLITTLDRSGKVQLWNPTQDGKLDRGISHTSLAGTASQALVAQPLLGRTTMMLGCASGHIEGVAMTATETGKELLSIHRFAGEEGAIEALASAPQGRLVAARTERGKASIYYVPTNRKLLEWETATAGTAATATRGGLFFSANGDAVGCWDGARVSLWKVRIPFPEASMGSFFSPIWYEGYQAPQHVWQSSTGNVEGEYKFGFMPLIFGTLKATFYSMLIAAPIALMAAIFGSEFMNSHWRARVKPVIELMASVPSVVLGFVGALVLAPVLRDNLVMVLLSVVWILFLFVFTAHLWLMIPSALAIRIQRMRLPMLFVLIPTGLWLASWLDAPVESILFGGDVIQWLSATTGSGWSGWFCLAILPSAILIAWLMSAPLSPWIQSYARKFSPFQFSIINLGLFLLATLAVLMVAASVASALSVIGWDPRGSVLGPYQERNALLVGGILGFAIIPLIYTISEDALQSVPQHLRSASLGCGATTWQTTMRVVVPTAMSGLFSALMIGFGRAIGETMVVLMAAGNTPVMDLNPMNGYRTLSATLATELPEAARGSTHFHALFLAAFLLFCFTMVANTIAEMVRMKFRKRAFQL